MEINQVSRQQRPGWRVLEIPQTSGATTDRVTFASHNSIPESDANVNAAVQWRWKMDFHPRFYPMFISFFLRVRVYVFRFRFGVRIPRRRKVVGRLPSVAAFLGTLLGASLVPRWQLSTDATYQSRNDNGNEAYWRNIDGNGTPYCPRLFGDRTCQNFDVLLFIDVPFISLLIGFSICFRLLCAINYLKYSDHCKKCFF